MESSRRFKRVGTLSGALCAAMLSACGEGVVLIETPATGGASTIDNVLDAELRQRIVPAGITGDIEAGRTLPAISDPTAQLGRDLFFTTGLGGNFEVACVTCHHPNLGGGDDLSLSVGVGAVDPTLMGPGRVHAESGHPNVPRNAPTVFNMGLWDRVLFWDGRVENLELAAQDNGLNAAIRTPDTAFGLADSGAGVNLTMAQAHFPVTSAAEMRTAEFLAGEDNETLRSRLAARIGDYGAGAGEMAENGWLERFRVAFGDADGSAEDLINYDAIAMAIAEYERSMVFTDNPFNQWVAGDATALTDAQKRGGVLFFTPVNEGGAGCSNCHTGDFFTDELMHNTAAIQIGEGKGNGNVDDFGRERETGNPADRYKFRTPTLLNVSVTGPYGHAGAYDTLAQVVAHYSDPDVAIDDWFDRGGVCGVEQFSTMPDCAALYPDTRANSVLALQALEAGRGAGDNLFVNADLTEPEQSDLVAFLEALTDPCVEDPDCMSPWVADPQGRGPDGRQLNGVDRNGAPLAQ